MQTLLEMLDVRVNSNFESNEKWQSGRQNVKVGEVILVISADVLHGQWLLGRGVEVVKGDDVCMSCESSG